MMTKSSQKTAKTGAAGKCASPTSTKAKLVSALWDFWPAFQRWGDKQCHEKSLTPQRTRILAALHERGPQIMSSLRDELGVTATNITALVDALESDGLVARKPHPEDRRATLIEVTPKADCEILAKGCSDYRERVGQLFDVLSESDRKELLRILDILQSRLEQGS